MEEKVYMCTGDQARVVTAPSASALLDFVTWMSLILAAFAILRIRLSRYIPMYHLS